PRSASCTCRATRPRWRATSRCSRRWATGRRACGRSTCSRTRRTSSAWPRSTRLLPVAVRLEAAVERAHVAEAVRDEDLPGAARRAAEAVVDEHRLAAIAIEVGKARLEFVHRHRHRAVHVAEVAVPLRGRAHIQ